MGKCLKEMSVFTISENENHRIKSKKNSRVILKTKDCEKRFKEERYLSANDILVASTEKIFYVKGKCETSMKK